MNDAEQKIEALLDQLTIEAYEAGVESAPYVPSVKAVDILDVLQSTHQAEVKPAKHIFCICDDKGTICPVHNFDEFVRIDAPLAKPVDGELEKQLTSIVLQILARGRLNQQELEGKIGVRDMGINYRKQQFVHELVQLFSAHLQAAQRPVKFEVDDKALKELGLFTKEELQAAVINAFKSSTNQNISGEAKYWGDGEYNADASTKFFPQEWFDERFMPALMQQLKQEGSDE